MMRIFQDRQSGTCLTIIILLTILLLLLFLPLLCIHSSKRTVEIPCKRKMFGRESHCVLCGNRSRQKKHNCAAWSNLHIFNSGLFQPWLCSSAQIRMAEIMQCLIASEVVWFDVRMKMMYPTTWPHNAKLPQLILRSDWLFCFVVWVRARRTYFCGPFSKIRIRKRKREEFLSLRKVRTYFNSQKHGGSTKKTSTLQIILHHSSPRCVWGRFHRRK